MILIKNEIVTALIGATLVTLLVILNTPQSCDKYEIRQNRAISAIKAFLIALFVLYAVIYFFSNNQGSSIMANMKTGEPNF